MLGVEEIDCLHLMKHNITGDCGHSKCWTLGTMHKAYTKTVVKCVEVTDGEGQTV